jgi:hypothetical protein
VEAVKLHLAALGVKDPADVSRSLMAELGARSNLESLLQAVAEFLQRRGLPRRLNKKTSLKITRELNKRCVRMLANVAVGSVSTLTVFQSLCYHMYANTFSSVRCLSHMEASEHVTRETTCCLNMCRMLAGASWKGYGSGSSSQGGSFHHRQADGNGVSAAAARGGGRCAGGGCEAAGGELGSEATDLSSCDWQSSLQLDASDGASMGDGLGMEDSWDGSVLDGIDLAGEGAEASFAAGRASQQQQQSAAPSLRAVPVVRADAPSNPAADGSSTCCLTARFGPVIRLLGTGDSFGELALLQSSATRTATVLVAPDSGGSLTARGQQGARGAAAAGALLIKISRSCYDATVRALQVG